MADPLASSGVAQQQILVRICDPEHPHYPEHGRLTGEMISLFGKPMALLKLDHCKHGTEGCYVSKGQVVETAEPRAVRRRK